MDSWAGPEERAGIAFSLLARAGVVKAFDPWDLAQRLGVRVDSLHAPGLEGMCLPCPATIWISHRGTHHARRWRLAHEIAHLAAHWWGAAHPHNEEGIDDIARMLLAE